MRGIYRIINTNNRKEYIGKSKHILNRKRSHLKDLQDGTHHNYKMQADYTLTDTGWQFEVVCLVPWFIPLAWVENHYIRLLTERDYNIKRPAYSKWEIPFEILYWISKQLRLLK